MKLNWKTGRVIGCVICITVLIIFCIYYAVAVSYREKFFPGTIINGVNLGNADVDEAVKELEIQLEDYSLQVQGRDLKNGESTILFEVTAEDIDLTVQNVYGDVEALLNQQNEYSWPLHWGRRNSYSLVGNTTYDADKLVAFLEGQSAFWEDATFPSRDACIRKDSEEGNAFVIELEVFGTRLDESLAVEVIAAAIQEKAEVVRLEEYDCYQDPDVLASDEKLQSNLAQINKWLETDITYDWNTNKVRLTKEEILGWIKQQDGIFVLDKEAVKTFVEENAAEYDTYGKSRAFRTTLGYDLLLPSGAFGWLTDCEAETKELLALIEAGSVCEREPIYASKAPWRGMNDIGNSYVEADMTHQHLYLYQNGTLVLESDFVSGDMSKHYDTPEGVFGLTYKTTNAILRGGDYAEHVTYWMPYHGNYGMHDATWRTEFGGDIYQNNGSHGCINLPLEKAGEIYQYVSEGFPVVCYYYPPGVLPEPETYDSDDEDD